MDVAYGHRNNIRHNNLGRAMHWELCRKVRFEHTNELYGHELSYVLESKQYKI